MALLGIAAISTRFHFCSLGCDIARLGVVHARFCHAFLVMCHRLRYETDQSRTDGMNSRSILLGENLVTMRVVDHKRICFVAVYRVRQ